MAIIPVLLLCGIFVLAIGSVAIILMVIFHKIRTVGNGVNDIADELKKVMSDRH